MPRSSLLIISLHSVLTSFSWCNHADFFGGNNFAEFWGTIRKVVFDLLPLSLSSDSMKIMESRIFEPDLMCQMGFLR